MDRSLRRREIVRHACWLAVFVVAVLVGRATVVDGRSLSLIWPAAGVAVCWMLASRGTARAWVLLTVGVVVAVGNGLTGAAGGLIVGLVAANVCQTLLATYGLERWVGHLRGCGGHEPLVRIGDLGRIIGVVLGACVPAAMIGTMTLVAVDAPTTPVVALTWVGRNVIGMLGTVVLWLLLLPIGAGVRGRVAARPWGPRVRETVVAVCFGAHRDRLALRTVEVVLLTVLMLAPWAAGNVPRNDVTFLQIVLMVWAGLRLAAPAVVAYGLVSALVGVMSVLAGHGSLGEIQDPMVLAVNVQLFVAVTALTGLALAFNRSERDAVLAELGERARLEQEEAAEMSRILDTVDDGLVVVEPDGAITLANRAARELLGRVEDEFDHVLTAEEYGLVGLDGQPIRDADLPHRPALRGEALPAQDYQVRRASVPADRILQIGALPLPGEPVRALVHLRDVTAERRQHEALSSFAGVVAHDLMNPIALVQGWAETVAVELEGGPLDPAIGTPMIERIQTGAQRMRSLVDDLLGYTLARDAQVLPQAVDVTALVQEIAVLRESGPRQPTVEVEPRLAAWADRALVRQLLDNLIGNSIKYTDPAVRPIVRITGTQDGAWTELRITDNGVGIPPEKREQVFAAFERGGTTLSSGTGLGLSICRQIVERHRGSIRAEGGPHGSGTTIVVRLPRTPAAYDDPDGAVRRSVPAPRSRPG